MQNMIPSLSICVAVACDYDNRQLVVCEFDPDRGRDSPAVQTVKRIRVQKIIHVSGTADAERDTDFGRVIVHGFERALYGGVYSPVAAPGAPGWRMSFKVLSVDHNIIIELEGLKSLKVNYSVY
jgi:hypothetical protein